MFKLRALGATSAFAAGVFFFLADLNVSPIAQTVAWIAMGIFGLYALGTMIRLMRMVGMRHQFLQDPDLGEKAFSEVEDDMLIWTKNQFNKLTNRIFLAVLIFAACVWVPALTA